MTALERSELAQSSIPASAIAPVGEGLQHRPQAGDYSGYFARLILLAATFGAGYLLDQVSGGRPYFGFLVISGVILVCIGLIMGPHTQLRSARIAVPLFDLAWITFAMYLTDGLSSFVLPLLYIVVAMAAMRGDRWEIGTSLAGAVTAIFILASTNKTGTTLSLAVAQATLLAAGALAIRLAVSTSLPTVAARKNHELYDALLQKTSDAVFTMAPGSWYVLHANPAAAALLNGTSPDELRNKPLDEIIGFTDRSFPRTCRQTLAAQQPVVDAVTHAVGPNGQKLLLRCNMMPIEEEEEEDEQVVQAIIEMVEAQEIAPTRGRCQDDFSLNYIPSLTHELNNHLAAIRLSAELAATTGKVPDFNQMQQQVDFCQDVLQTVVVQILRSSGPAVTPDRPPTAELQTVMERVLLLTRPQILTSSVQLQVDIPPDLPPVVGFAHELQEALIRIIIQSVKTMAQRESVRALTIAVTPRSRHVEILITDVGPGLAARELAVLSGKQVAVSRAEDRTWEIARDALCRFGGEIQAGNGLHGGMRLRLLLPISAELQVVASA